jgi:hypothetical protein
MILEAFVFANCCASKVVDNFIDKTTGGESADSLENKVMVVEVDAAKDNPKDPKETKISVGAASEKGLKIMPLWNLLLYPRLWQRGRERHAPKRKQGQLL